MIEVSPNLKERIKRNRDDLNSYKHLPNEGWDVYGSTIEDYNGIFTLAKKPISEIAKTKEELVVIDFMGSSEAIASLFGKLLGKKKMGISVSFADVRKHEQVKRDENLNIQQIAGDILERKTWKEVEKALGDKRADIIMERGVGAIQSLPSSAIIYWSLLNRAWKLLKEDGIILAQIPYKSHVSNSKVRIKEWIKQLNDKGIKASYKDFPFKNGNMVLERNPDSPDNLPTLPKTELT